MRGTKHGFVGRALVALPFVAAAAFGAFLYLRGTGRWLEGAPIRLIEAADEPGLRLSPLPLTPATPAESPAVASERGKGKDKGLRKLLALSPLYVKAGNARISDVAFRIELGGDTRSALACLAPTRIVYKVVVPPGARLRFGLGRSGPKAGGSSDVSPAASSRLRISVEPILGRARTVFVAEGAHPAAGKKPGWEEVVVPLESYSGRKLRVLIEADSRPEGPPARDVFYLANPILAADEPPSPDRPNIILVAADALRADHLGCYGYGRKTSPAIDAFSREAVLFENAVSQAPWTLPSFASLFTSLYPSFHGTTVNDTRLVPGSPTLVDLLRRSGYTTMASVENMFVFPRYGFAEGFDVFYGPRETVEEQLSLVGEWLGSGPRRPLFLFYHLLIPHAPYEAPAPFSGAFRGGRPPIVDASNRALKALEERLRPPSPAELEDLRALYDERILYLDSLVGGLWADLKKLGLYDNSLIVFLSDHGEQFLEHGHLIHAHTLYQEEVHVPLIIKWPKGRGPGGLRVGARVLGIDVAATILDELKIALPAEMQGRSLRPALAGKEIHDEVVFSELNFLGRTAAFKGPYKYIVTDPAAYAEGMKTHGLKRHRTHALGPLEELYDLGRDPGEKLNIIGQHPDLVEMFRREVRALAERAVDYRRKKLKAAGANKITLDESEKEKLRALGYLR